MQLSMMQRMWRKAASLMPMGRRDLALARPCLSISFDDFPMSAWTQGRPVLEHYGARATFFASGSYCGRTVQGERQFDARTLNEICETDHEIGCHTFDHYNACTVSTKRFLASVDRNARFFEEVVPGASITSFAFPYGDMTPGTKAALSKRFASCRSSVHGMNSGVVETSSLRAMFLQSNALSHYDIDAMLEAGAEAKAWIVALTHDISDSPSDYGCRPEDLARLLQSAYRHGYDILPVGAVAGRA